MVALFIFALLFYVGFLGWHHHQHAEDAQSCQWHHATTLTLILSVAFLVQQLSVALVHTRFDQQRAFSLLAPLNHLLLDLPPPVLD